jgi:hypothetical protein
MTQSTSATAMKMMAAMPFTTPARTFFNALSRCSVSWVPSPSTAMSRIPCAAPK